MPVSLADCAVYVSGAVVFVKRVHAIRTCLLLIIVFTGVQERIKVVKSKTACNRSLIRRVGSIRRDAETGFKADSRNSFKLGKAPRTAGRNDTLPA